MLSEINRIKYYSTSDACKLAGTSRATFLRWVRLGQFEDVRTRDHNGWRLFTEEDITRLKAKSSFIYNIESETLDTTRPAEDGDATGI